MTLRLIELILPQDHADRLKESFDATDFEIHGLWTENLDDGRKLVRVLASAGGTEAVLDDFQERFSWLQDYRVILLPVEATLPRPKASAEGDKPKRVVGRINREELYADLQESARLSPVFMVMVALSTVVAAVGLVRDSSVIVLSAMVIAPLLGPNIALALATTLGDLGLARTALRSSAVGFSLALVLAVVYGLLVEYQPEAVEIASRTRVGMGDLALALAAGAAGALSLTSAARGSLIGVMVAVALLPPTIVTGMLVGGGHLRAATGAAELVAINLVCLILAGIVTFLAQGIRPNKWWQAEVAKKATSNALVAGIILLALLSWLVLLQV